MDWERLGASSNTAITVAMRHQKILIFALSAEGGFEMDVKDIITKVAGNKDLLDKLKSADVNQAKDLLNKAGVKVDEADVKKVKDALADGKIDMKEIKDIAGGIFK